MLGRWEELKMGQETKGCEDGDAKGRSVEEESSGKFYEGRKGCGAFVRVTQEVTEEDAEERKERTSIESVALRHSAAATLTDSHSLTVCTG